MGHKKLCFSDLDCRVFSFNSDNQYLHDYFTLRYNVFTHFNLNFYKNNQPTPWDQQPDTLFILLIHKKNNQVMGGRRIGIHKPFSKAQIYCEYDTHYAMQQMLPHLETSNLYYAEFGGLCLHENLRGCGISTEYYQKSFNLMAEMKIDFIVSNPVKSNKTKLEEAAYRNNIKQIVWRNDLITLEDGDFEPTIFMSFYDENQLPLNPYTSCSSSPVICPATSPKPKYK